MRLDRATAELYERNGFIVLDEYVDRTELARIIELSMPLFGSEQINRDGLLVDYIRPENTNGTVDMIPQALDVFRYEPRLRETMFYQRSCEVAAGLLGVPAVSYRGSQLTKKPARTGPYLPWHQDEAYWEPHLEHRMLSICLPFMDVDRSNGCLSYIPGSHRRGVVPHRRIGGNEYVHGLEVALHLVDSIDAVPAPVCAGGVSIHHQAVIHDSAPNISDRDRVVLVLDLGIESRPRAEPRSFHWQESKCSKAERRKELGYQF